MTSEQLKDLIRRKTQTTSDTYSDADMLSDVNVFLEDIAGRIQQERQSIWNVPSLDDLVADQREYAFPEDVLNSLVSLELDLGDGYVKATTLKKTPDIALTEDKIKEHYTNDNPYYFIRRQAIYILSENVSVKSDGIRLVYNSFPKLLENLTGNTDMSIDPSDTEHGFPREFHELLARRVSIEYKDRNSLPLSTRETLYEPDLEKKLSEFSIMDLSEENIINVPSSSSLGDHGYDY